MSTAPRRLLPWKILPVLATAALSVWATHGLVESTTPFPSAQAGPPSPPSAPHAFLRQWCYDCHGDGSAKGGFAMDGDTPLTENDWDKIRRHVALRTMPPEDKPAPPTTARDAFEQDLLTWQASQPDASFPPPFRRLNRREFVNSLQDLLGTAPVLSDLPDEETAHGFDNNADLQPLPPAALERYLAVTRETVRAALLPAPVRVTLHRFMPQEFSGPGSPPPDAPGFYEIETGHAVLVPITLPSAGTYRFTLRAYAHQAGEDPVQVVLQKSTPLPLRSTVRTLPENLETLTELPAGASTLSFRLDNPYQNPRHPDPHRRIRRLLVQEVILEGPLSGNTTPSAAFIQRFGLLPLPAASLENRLRWADRMLEDFAVRAWRRPLSLTESSRLTGLAGDAMAHGLRDDEALAVAVQAILISPHFLFLPDPARSVQPLRSHATAARLSYLLWSTLPDKTLRAESDAPWEPRRLAASARRLLDDSRAAAFARNFAGQWLQLRNASLARPDTFLFPETTPEIRQAMQESAARFFLHLVRENEPVLRLLDADYTFQQTPAPAESLTPAPADLSFIKIPVTDPDRRGLLGQPAVLLLTSYPNRTSPVLRGKYILETLLGLEPPPPPPNVPTLQPAATPAHGPRTVRAALELHRADRACAACHRAIDPLGFPLEAFDAIGRPSGAAPAELVSTTFTGTVLHRPADLTAWLIREQGLRVVHHTAERLLTYALGRGLSPAEILTAQRTADQCGGRDARFRDLLLALITGPVFSGENPPD